MTVTRPSTSSKFIYWNPGPVYRKSDAQPLHHQAFPALSMSSESASLIVCGL